MEGELDIRYSFVIPHKNSKSLLQRCVNSIPYRNDIEIIVVDDNSIEEQKPYFPQDNITVIYINKEESKGAGHARNVGLKEVKGEWVLFPDCDDYYVNGFIDILESVRNKDINVVYFNCIYKDGQTGIELPKLSLNIDFENYDGCRYSIDTIKFHHNAPWTKMIKRSCIKDNNLHFEEVVNGNDLFFSMSLGYSTDRIEVIKQPLYVYVRNQNSLTKKKLTPNEAMCVVKHTVQMNTFFKFIGYPKWSLPLLKIIVLYIKDGGFPFLLLLLKKLPNIISRRKDLINYACSNKF